MKIALIGCMVLLRDISKLIHNSPHTVHPFWFEQGLHDTPDLLRKRLQKCIDDVEELSVANEKKTPFDAIVLAYGLCSNAVTELTSKTLPIIVPRCDDCIALFLGSQNRYLDYFNSLKGVYWYNKPWCENAFNPSEEAYERLFQKYAEQFGEENAEYLLETENSYTKNYENAVFIKSGNYDDEVNREQVKANAEHFGWNYKEVEGDDIFLQELLSGNWENEERFLVCPKNHTIKPDYEGKKVKAEPNNS